MRWRVPLRLLRSAWSEFEKDYARYFAVAIVYYALISLVPLLLLSLAAVGLFLRSSELASELEQHLLDLTQASFGAQLRATLDQSLQWLQQESIVATLVSSVTLLIAASALFRHLRMTFRAIWKHAPPLVSGRLRVIVKTTVIENIISFAIVLGAATLLLFTLALVVAVQWMARLVGMASVVPAVVAIFSVPLIFALLFKVLPPVRLPWRHVWFASALCAITWLIGAELFALYGSHFSKNAGAYGAFGALLVLMLWMKIMSQVLFFGAELCKVSASGPSEASELPITAGEARS